MKRTISSNSLADVIGSKHSELLKIVNNIVKKHSTLPKPKVPIRDWIIESSYIDKKGEVRKCYNFTEEGINYLIEKSTKSARVQTLKDKEVIYV